MWAITGQLLAFDAVSLKLLYTTNQAPNGRDTLPPVGHFVTQTVVNGKVYVGTQNSLEAYGLFQVATVTGGNAQTATVSTALPAPIQVEAANPYNGQPDVGATVNFSDGCKAGTTACGSFNPASAVTNSNGNASTTIPGSPESWHLHPDDFRDWLRHCHHDCYRHGRRRYEDHCLGRGETDRRRRFQSPERHHRAGRRTPIGTASLASTIHFTANKERVPNPSSVVTDANGLARTTLRLPTIVSTVTVTASSAGLKTPALVEYSVAGPAAKIAITSGNNQSAPPGTQLPQALTVLVTDQYGNTVPGVNVAFDDGGAGGTYSYANPASPATPER